MQGQLCAFIYQLPSSIVSKQLSTHTANVFHNGVGKHASFLISSQNTTGLQDYDVVTEALNALSAFIILRISTFSNVKWCNTKKSSITRYMFLLASSTELSSRSTSNGTSNWYLSTFTIQKTKQQASEHYSPTIQYTTLICY